MKYGDIVHYTGWDSEDSIHDAAIYIAPVKPSRFSNDLVALFSPGSGVSDKTSRMWAPCVKGECSHYGIWHTEGDTR